jgi:ligand-binding sensor domain-containing protein
MATVFFCLSALPAVAQEVSFTSLTAARECRVLLPDGERIYGGLSDGGVVVWDAADPALYTRWTVGEGLSGQRVTALAASGSHIWVATSGAGLTRVTPGAVPEFRQYANLGGLDITTVIATTRGTAEVVYYGLLGAGVGVINSGLPGTIYTQEEHGLVGNSVSALAFLGNDLWVGTEEGVSRFAANVFTTEVAGLTDLRINTLQAVGDTLLLAGAFTDGVFRWDGGAARWERLGALDGLVLAIAAQDGAVWALLEGVGSENRLWRWDGATWTAASLPEPRTRVIAQKDGALWCAGLRIDPDREPNGRAARAFLARRDEAAWSPWATDELLFLGVDGVSFGPDGALWLGSREGVGVARQTAAGQWGQVAGLATVANDSTGLFTYGANILALAGTPDGDVWVTQYDFHLLGGGGGLLRLRPGAAVDLADVAVELLPPAEAPPGHHRTVRIVRHPDGPLMMCTDLLGVDVLVEPARPRDPAAWVRLPVDTDGLGGGVVRDAVVARRDVVWFTVNGIGLMRWDINGPAGPEAPLTWSDLADDVWTGPIAAVSGTSFNFAQARTLAASADGTLWAGGSGGVAHLRPLDGGGAVLLAAYGAKADVYLAGLLTGTVSDLELDDNGDLWVALEGGLNRIRQRGDETTIDAWTNLEGYDAYGLGSLYSPSVLAGLPGAIFYELASDPGSGRLLAGSNYGAVVIDVAPLGAADADALAGLFLYPNPFAGGTGAAGLKLDGVTAEVTTTGSTVAGGVTVEVYDLQGQLVHRASHVGAGDPFWDGRNLQGDPVSSGLYMVKVTLDGQNAVRTLAVVR